MDSVVKNLRCASLRCALQRCGALSLRGFQGGFLQTSAVGLSEVWQLRAVPHVLGPVQREPLRSLLMPIHFDAPFLAFPKDPAVLKTLRIVNHYRDSNLLPR